MARLPPVPAALVRAAPWPLAVFCAYLLGWAVAGEAVRQPLVNGGLHLAGGAASAHLAAALLEPLAAGHTRRMRAALLAAGCLALTTTVAVGWEFLECLVARLLGVRGPSDGAGTLLDLALGMAGAAGYALRYGATGHRATNARRPCGEGG